MARVVDRHVAHEDVGLSGRPEADAQESDKGAQAQGSGIDQRRVDTRQESRQG
jgi:hypothetical protein